MKCFALDDHGDVIFEKNDIKIAYDTDLMIQKIRQVLSTNRGEWWLQPKEGVPVQKILKKNPDMARIKDCIRSAIAQVDNTLEMTRCDIKTEGRQLRITFTVSGKNGTIKMETGM